jgi:tetratricopeptide (TPR) repeat protein
LDLQEEVARAIVGALRMKLGGGRITKPESRDFETYARYLEGRYHCNRRTRAGFLKALECFEQVLARDGRMAAAWAGLAECHLFLGLLLGIPPGETVLRIKAAAQKALEIDASLPDAHCSLGTVSAAWEYDWTCAEGHFRQALALRPNHANSHMLYGGHLLAPLGRLQEAADHTRRACELDPLSPPTISSLGASWLMLRRPDEAIAACRRTLGIDPAYPLAYRWMGEAYLLKGMLADAASAFSRVESPFIGAGFTGYCLARTGHDSEARQLLRNLETIGMPSPALQIALVQLGLGDRDSALTWLHKACVERSNFVHWLKVEPVWDPLRPDPRFAAILREMRLGD